MMMEGELAYSNPMTESAFIQWIRQFPGGRVPVGPGDDCAVLAPSNRPTLITTDMLMEGVDFFLAEAGPRAVGRKSMAVNLSDIAAMAGTPTAAVVSVCLPKSGCDARELFLGLKELADEFDVPIVGGDTNAWNGGLVVSITVLGEPNPRIGPVLRSGAKPGDWLFVTGPLGGSLRGRHLNPHPRIREARELADRFPLHAMIDISDGLATDAIKLARESGCGIALKSSQIPIHSDAFAMSGKEPLDRALSDGEDFELLFAVHASGGPEVAASGLAVKIGECVSDGYWLDERPLANAGWEYRLSED